MGNKLLAELNSIYSLSGSERELIGYLHEKLSNISDSCQIDTFGNLVCKKGKSANELAIFVHADKVGFMVSKVEPKVQVVGLSHEVEGEIKAKKKYPMVVLKKNGEQQKVALIKSGKKLVLVGGNTLGVSVGDTVAYEKAWKEDAKKIVTSGLDNDLGLVAGIKLFESLPSGTLVITVQEEMGFHGARSAVGYLKPRKIYVIDVTYADDKNSAVVAGGGVSFCVKDNFLADKKMLSELIWLAKKSSINYQLEVISSGSSDYAGVFGGIGIVPFVFIGIPIKNMHSYKEEVLKKDFESVLKFMKVLGENQDKI